MPIDAIPLTPLSLTDQQRALYEASAKARADLGLARAHTALFTALHYGHTSTPDDLLGWAVLDDYNPTGPKATEDECRVALGDCLARGWLQILTESTRERIQEELRSGGYLGPIRAGGGPEVGFVDFAEAGLVLWRRLQELFRPVKKFPLRELPFAYQDVVHEKTARFFRTAAAAAVAIEEIRTQEDVVAVSGPTNIGPWRVQWWRRFPEGYRIDVEERRHWQGRAGGGGERCHLDHSSQRADPGRLQDVLDRHNVTLAEWVVMEHMERGYGRERAKDFCRAASESGNRLLGHSITEKECLEGLKACLRYGWLTVLDQQAVDEVKSLLAADSALLALPSTAEGREKVCSYTINPDRPGQLWPIPMPDAYWKGRIDFTPAGAALYQMTSAEWLGPVWEDSLDASRVYYWEEHHYCETDEGFDRIVQQHIAKGETVRAKRVVPIGPWCVHWWERFPSGYRLELELGEC